MEKRKKKKKIVLPKGTSNHDVHFDVRAIWCKQLLASLGSEARINRGENDIANGNLATALMLLDPRRQEVLLNMARFLPRREEAHLAEIPIVGKVELWPKAQNLTVEDDGARIVPAVAVEKRKTNIDDDAVQRLVGQDGVQRVPRVLVDLVLEEVVQTAVSGDLELGADAQGRAGLLGLMDALLDPADIVLIV